MIAPREALRRSVHIGVGAFAFLLPHVAWPWLALVCLGGFLMNLWVMPRWGPLRLLEREGPESGRTGLLLYPLVLLVLMVAFRERWEPVFIAWMALALGDGLPPVLARMIPGGPAWPWNRTKRVLPTCGAFAVATLVSLVHLPLAPTSVAMGAAALAESLPGPGDDNLRVPVTAALVGALALGAPT